MRYARCIPPRRATLLLFGWLMPLSRDPERQRLVDFVLRVSRLKDGDGSRAIRWARVLLRDLTVSRGTCTHPSTEQSLFDGSVVCTDCDAVIVLPRYAD